MVEAVIFDFDGTLMDTEAIHTRSIKETVKAELSIELSDKAIQYTVGMTYGDKFKVLLKGKKYDSVDLANKTYDYYKKIFEREIKLRNGVNMALKLISAKGLKIGLYSPNEKSVLKISLKKFNILEYFQVIVSVEDVKKPKPDPEGYLLAAKKLGVKAEDCLVFEDTPTGFTSAKNAGMKVVVLYNPYLKNPEYPGADGFTRSFNDVNADFLKNF